MQTSDLSTITMDPSKMTIPDMKDMTIDNITSNTILINSQGSDRRLQFLLERLVTHIHDFARETRLSTKEWMAALNFLVAVGQISTDVRHVCCFFSCESLWKGRQRLWE